MKLLNITLLIAGSTQALGLVLYATNTTTTTDVPTATPTHYAISCSAGLQSLCGDLCFCSSGSVNCHADPTSRCMQMCNCHADES
ncbi:hypothetical protein F5B20DRAFT_119775 [Whalleya microplaca]|nr:hypothetical protein F5B20DRAFT_119775 [Whalleya microplaca]